MSRTTIRASRETWAGVARMAAVREQNIDATVSAVLRVLRQDAVAHDLARPLDGDEVEWLEAEIERILECFRHRPRRWLARSLVVPGLSPLRDSLTTCSRISPSPS